MQKVDTKRRLEIYEDINENLAGNIEEAVGRIAATVKEDIAEEAQNVLGTIQALGTKALEKNSAAEIEIASDMIQDRMLAKVAEQIKEYRRQLRA